MHTCLLKLILDNDLYDDITDSLLAFPKRELEFMGFPVQAHTKNLEDISEQVSGFKQKMVIEITTDENEGKNIFRYLKDTRSEARFDGQLLPLLTFDGSPSEQ